MVVDERSPLEEEKTEAKELDWHWQQNLAGAKMIVMVMVMVMVMLMIMVIHLASSIFRNLLMNTMARQVAIATKKVNMPFTWRKFPG